MTKRILICTLLATGGLWFLSPQIAAGSGSGEAAGTEPGHGLDPVVLAGVAVMLIIAKLGGELFERFRQPAVLGELVGGIFIGNLTLIGVTMAEPLKTNVVISALAELGVIILLFEVGLQSDLGEMLEVGWSSLSVAIAGVVVPFFLGWGVSAYFLPSEPTLVHIFIGATLCATSVGITARVLKDLDALRSREARIILGAAVIDDVLGLLVLAVVAGAVKSEAAGAVLSSWQIVIIALKAFTFLVGLWRDRPLLPDLQSPGPMVGGGRARASRHCQTCGGASDSLARYSGGCFRSPARERDDIPACGWGGHRV